MDTFSIYALIHPVTGAIYYVGSTGIQIRHRLAGHLSYNKGTTAEIISMGLRPEIFELDVCNRSERYFMEDYWIWQVKSWGFTIDNKRTENCKDYKIIESDNISQIQMISNALIELSPSITWKMKTVAARKLNICTATLVSYLNGNVKNENKAASILNCLNNLIQKAERKGLNILSF